VELLFQSVDRAIDLLFHLHEQPQARGVSELARALGLPKSTVHRLLQALARRGLVEQEGGRYAPGARLVGLGLGAQERDPVVGAARPVLDEEARALGETVFLMAPRSAGLVVLDKAEGAGFLRAAPRLGEAVPLHATAAGKLAFAFAPERFPLEAGGAERFTARTVVDPDALRVEVERARRQGFAENHGEWIDGLSVVAAPVLLDVASGARRLIAVLAVAAATPRLRELGAARVARRAVDAARRLSARLNGKDASTPEAARPGAAVRSRRGRRPEASPVPPGAQRAVGERRSKEGRT
jgi:IclR family acetate operon transcriptional repressor